MKAHLYLNSINKTLSRPEIRVAAILLACAAFSGLQAQGTPTALAAAVGDSAKPWILWTIRILAGAMAGGGLLSLISGFTGNEEGFAKASKVLGGLILMGVGIYCLATPDTIYTTLNLNQMFTA
jgi:hypothetical protein